MTTTITYDQDQAALAKINDSAPSLSGGAMLMLLTIKVWEGRKMDRGASDQVAMDNGITKKKMTSVHKSLVDSDELDAIKALRGVARNHVHYHLTQPWSDLGLRFITTKAYFEYVPRMQELQAQFKKLVTTFLDNYSFEIAKAEVELGTLFNAADYPTREELEGKFIFEYQEMPMPESGDFRLDIEKEQRDHLAQGYAKFYENQFSVAMRDVWERLMQPLANMIDKLDYAEGEEKKRFKSTLVDNVLEIVEVMSLVNVTGDERMTKVEQGLTQALQGVTAEALRDDAYLRKTTRAAALEALKETKSVMDSIPSLFS